MAPSAEYKTYVLELLEKFGNVRTARFFGGVGLRLDSTQFAMIMGNNLYFVVDDTVRDKYKRAGMQPFSYLTKNGRVQVRRYYEVPEDVLNDPDQLRRWASESVRIASLPKR